jgi:hypothetical protein
MTVVEQLYVAETLPKEENLNVVNKLRLAYVLGIPFGAFVGYISILIHYNVIIYCLDLF